MIFDYAALAAAGFDTVVIEYSGSGDEGFINEVNPSPLPEGALTRYSEEFADDIEQAAYNLLHDHFGGWEINEGSSGTITVNIKARKTSIHHGWVVESIKYEDKELE